jgi:transcriptional regulator with XRE-family HTH domain
MHFSQNISHLLRIRRWNNSDLARELKISSQQVGRYANGKNEPKMEALVEIARLFNVTVDDLILIDLSKEEGRPFGGGVESAGDTDEQTKLLNKLLLQRVQLLERSILAMSPERARELGIDVE